MKKGQGWITVALCVVSALAGAALTLCALFFYLGEGGVNFLMKINAVHQIIDKTYVGEADWDGVADEASAGMISALDDRWSYYMTAEEYASYQSFSTNMSSGIGVTISKEETLGGFEILSVAPGSPAEEAGIKSGWVLISVEDERVFEMSSSELKKLIMSQTGDFHIGFIQEDGAQTEVTVHTGAFYTNPVSYELLDGDIGYIRIANFEEGAAENAIDAVKTLSQEGAGALIFDVRSNPGGRLAELMDLLDYILPEGDLFVSIGKKGDETVYTSDAACIDMPIAVLINASSYSAAEFFAAALSEYDYAVTIGEASTGKGRSQVTYALSDGSAVHLSTRRYLTPNRVDLSEQGGLVPDIAVALAGDNDTQLEEATKYLS